MKSPVIIKHFAVLLTVCLALLSSVCLANEEKPFTSEEEMEIDALRGLTELLPLEGQNPDFIIQQFLSNGFILEMDKFDAYNTRKVLLKKETQYLETSLYFLAAQQTIDAYSLDSRNRKRKDLYKDSKTESYRNNDITKIWQQYDKYATDNSLDIISKETMRQELEDVYPLAALTPFEKNDPDNLKQQLIQLGYKIETDKTDQFGFTRIVIYKESSYKVIVLYLGVFNNELANYHLVIPDTAYAWRFSNQPDTLINKLKQLWKQNSDTALYAGQEEYGDMVALQSFPDVYSDYFKVVTGGLGALNAVTVPKDLLTSYAALVSDKFRHTATKESVSYSDLERKIVAMKNQEIVSEAINKLFIAKRIDLIENVLNGFNPLARSAAKAKLKSLGLAKEPVV
jgi:hypothetical protein